MPVLFVARSVQTGKWSSDVGRGKNVYKVGISDGEDPKALAAAGWAGESDWKIVGQQEVEALDETEAIERLGKKERMLEVTQRKLGLDAAWGTGFAQDNG